MSHHCLFYIWSILCLYFNHIPKCELPFYLYECFGKQDDDNIFRFHVVFIKHLFVSCNYISSWIWCNWQKIYMNLASNHHELAYLYTHSGHWFLIFPIPATLIFGNCTKWERGNFFKATVSIVSFLALFVVFHFLHPTAEHKQRL